MMLERVWRGCMRIGLVLVVTGCFAFPQQPSSPKKHPIVPTHSHQASPAISFVDVTQAAGIDFHLTCGSPEKRYIMESMCGGVAVFDYDNDGWMDILLVNGSTL